MVTEPLTAQLTMAYGFWMNDMHNHDATFEVFFRKNPFKGEFTVTTLPTPHP